MASRFWVGGGSSANWNATGPTNWGTASNTQDNASVPGSSDDVFFDGVGTGASNSTLSANITIKSLDMTGYTNTLTHNSSVTLTVNNNTFTLATGMTYTLGSATTSAISLTSTAGTIGSPTNITTADKTLGNLTINGSGGYFKFLDNVTLGNGATLTLTAGILNINGQTVNIGIFSSTNSNTRNLDYTTGTINITGNNTTVWNTSTSTNLTFTRGGSLNANYSGSIGTRTFTGSSTETSSSDMNISAGSDTISISSGWRNVDFTGFTGTLTNTGITLYGNLNIASGMTMGNGSNAMLFAATSGTKTITTNGKTIPVPITFNGAGGTFQLADNLTLSNSFSFTLTAGTFDPNGKTVTFTGTAPTLVGSFTFYNLTITGGAFTTAAFNITNSITVTNILAMNGNSYLNRLFFKSATFGTAVTVTAASVTGQYVDIRDITAAGAASPWDLSSITGGSGDCDGNTNITFTTGIDIYWQHGASASYNYSDSTRWFLATNGGGGAARVPLIQDNAIFDANSFGSAGKTVVQDLARYGTINFTGATNSPTFTASGEFYKSITLISGMSVTSNGTISYVGRSSSTFTTGNLSLPKSLTINCLTGTLLLGDNSIIGTTSSHTTTITSGTFDANGFNFTTFSLSSSNSTVRTIIMGSGQWTITGNGQTIINLITITNLTFTRGSLAINCTYSGSTGTRTIRIGGLTEANVPSVSVTAGSDAVRFDNGATPSGLSNSFYNLDFTGFTGTITSLDETFIYGSIILGAGIVSFSQSANLNFVATSGTHFITTNGKTLNTNIVITAPNAIYKLGSNMSFLLSSRTFVLTAGTFDANNYDFATQYFGTTGSLTRVITMGSGQWSMSSIVNATPWTTSASTNLTFNRGSLPITVDFTGSASARTFQIGATGENSVPSFSFTTGTNTLTINNNIYNLDMTGYTGTLANSAITIYGDLTLSSGTTYTAGTNTMTFGATSGTKTITTNGKTMDFPITFNGAGGTFQLADNLTVGATRTTTLTAGTFDINGKIFSTGLFSSSNSNIRTLKFAGGEINITAISASTIWTFATATNATIDISGGGLIKINGSTANIRTFSGGGLTYPNIWFSNATSNGELDFVGSNTFSNFKCDTPPQTIKFTASTTTTISTWEVSGTAGNLITIGTITAANHNLAKSGVGVISSDYLSISRSQASPTGTTWYAGENSTNGGNNTGWIFTAPPPTTNIKKIFGVDYLNVKTIMGIPIANIKNINGLD